MRAVAALLAALALAAPAHGVERVRLDPTRSQAGFGIGVLLLFDVVGRFVKVDGEVEVDRERQEAVVDARIAADSVRIDGGSREDWARSAEFFDAEHFPEIRFRSELFPLARLASGGPLEGRLTLRGVTRNASFELLPAECAHPARDCPVRAKGVIRRSMFGMRTRRGTLSDKVILELSIYALPNEAGFAPS